MLKDRVESIDEVIENIKRRIKGGDGSDGNNFNAANYGYEDEDEDGDALELNNVANNDLASLRKTMDSDLINHSVNSLRGFIEKVANIKAMDLADNPLLENFCKRLVQKWCENNLEQLIGDRIDRVIERDNLLGAALDKKINALVKERVDSVLAIIIKDLVN